MDELDVLSSLTDELIELFDREAQAQFDGSVIGDEAFAALSLRLFRLQVVLNPCYRKTVEAAGLTSVNDWRRLPCVPTTAFRNSDLSCIPEMEETRVFESSGTTRGFRSEHKHFRKSLALYHSSLRRWFFHHYRHPQNARLMILTPMPKAAPKSSLVHMFEAVSQDFDEARYYGLITDNRDRQAKANRIWNLDHRRLSIDWNEACRQNRPVALLGTAFSYVWLLNERELLPLPAESLLLETGGYKGQVREWQKNNLYTALSLRFGLDQNRIISEYGMCELSSQAYDHQVGNTAEQRLFRFPPWVRIQIISPETDKEVQMGETGLIRVFDLANAWSAMVVQTEDLGRWQAEGLQLMGRATEAELRGCSLMSEA